MVSTMAITGISVLAETSGDYKYEIIGSNSVIITDYIGVDRDIIIPSKLDSYTVLQIGEAFVNKTNITSVTIPDGVFAISNNAFENCTSLTVVNIPDSVNVIGKRAFQNCTSLKKISIPDSVTGIENEAFKNCSSLSQVILPNNFNFRRICYGVFEGCTSIKFIDIPDIVTDIESCAFKDCTSLVEFIIPTNVSTINYQTFENCSTLRKITIPTGVKSIEEYAFKNCSSLVELTIPPEVSTIGVQTFENCSSLKFIDLPDSLLVINNEAFKGCSSLSAITIPSNVTSIGPNAFQDCSSLTAIIIPNNVTTIGSNAFQDCTSLKSIIISAKVKTIGALAFAGCSALTDISVKSGNNEYYSENGVLFTKDKTTLIKYPSDKSETNYIIPNGVATIANDAFLGCKNLSNIIISRTVAYIRNNAFLGCINLKEIHIPKTVNTIEEKAFGYFENNELISDVIIKGDGNSTANKYADENNILFECLQHSWQTDFIVDKIPTCVQEGSMSNHCGNCYARINVTALPKLSHKTIVVNKKSSTYFDKGNTGDTACSACNEITKKGKTIAKKTLKKPSITVKSGKKQFAISISKVKDANGYQVRYRLGKGKWVTKKYSSKKAISKAFKKLKKGKKYSVEARAFIKKGKKTAYSSWCKAKTIKVK